jgi:hypothetical protein
VPSEGLAAICFQIFLRQNLSGWIRRRDDDGEFGFSVILDLKSAISNLKSPSAGIR